MFKFENLAISALPRDGDDRAGGLGELARLAIELKGASEDVKRIADQSKIEIKNFGDVTTETKAKADELIVKHTDIDKRITELEKKLSRDPGVDEEAREERKSVGYRLTESDAWKEFKSKGASGKFMFPVKAIISAATADANGSAGALLDPTRVPGIFGLPQASLRVRDLLTPGRTASNAISYVKETGFTNLAATVAENTGALKPQSEIKFAEALTAVTTIAHWVLATKQILDDAPQLQSYIDGRLRYGLAFVEDAQLLMGAGTGTDLNGIYTQASAYSAPFTPSGTVTMIDQMRLAMLQAFLAEYPATGVVMNPIDWARIELTKDTTGAYLIANPQGTINRTLWGLPVVETPAMTVDKFLVGAFRLGAQIFDREDANVLISTEDSDNFRKNLVTIRAEERLALAVYRPEAFIKGDWGNVA